MEQNKFYASSNNLKSKRIKIKPSLKLELVPDPRVARDYYYYFFKGGLIVIIIL